MYADYSLLAPHDVRAAKSRKFEGMIVGSDGHLCRMEQKRPPDHPAYAERAGVHGCSLLMAQMVSPPCIGAYLRMIARLSRDYYSCWPLLYQQCDRWRFEQVPQLLRKQQAKYDRYITRYGSPPFSDEESYFDPDYPFDHLLWMSVNAEAANKRWQENFARRADKILHGIKKIGDFLDGDAPIAADREHHAITSFHQPAASSGRHAVLPRKARHWLVNCV